MLNTQQVRKDLVFILNYAVDTLKKEPIEGSDLVQLSLEVKRFTKSLESANISTTVKSSLQEIRFEYSNNRDFLSAFPFLLFKQFFIKWFQQRHREKLLNNFLSKYDSKLSLLNV